MEEPVLICSKNYILAVEKISSSVSVVQRSFSVDNV